MSEQPVAHASRFPVLAVVGPTAAGKSEVALEVAEKIGAEIVAIDSMTIYRGMDIGTAKPSRAHRARVPHHLLDVADPARPFSVAQFQRAARATIAGVAARRKVPLLVGGSGLYFRAVVDDLQFPPTEASVRARLSERDPEDLQARLRVVDPESAERIEPSNVRRIVRALEVAELTGSPFSAFRESWDRYESRYDLTIAGIRVEPADLAAAIGRRVRAMLDAGLVEEVRGLLEQGLRDALTAVRAIGYREIVSYIDGDISLDQAAHRIETATRGYARRQMTWFRKDPRIRWFGPDQAVEIGEWFAGKLAAPPDPPY